MKRIKSPIAICLLAALAPVTNAQEQLPSFTATSLTGQVVTEQKLLGQPTVLIVTPSRAAADDTRQWAQALRRNIDQQKVLVRDILAIDLPFFISEEVAMDRAKETIPERYHGHTYLLPEGSLKEALNIPPSSAKAFVLVMNAEGNVIARVSGTPTQQRINEVNRAVSNITG